MPTVYHLYVKTHKKTGLKYLGQTKKDPFQYSGSGHRWTKHINITEPNSKSGNRILLFVINKLIQRRDI